MAHDFKALAAVCHASAQATEADGIEARVLLSYAIDLRDALRAAAEMQEAVEAAGCPSCAGDGRSYPFSRKTPCPACQGTGRHPLLVRLGLPAPEVHNG